MNDSFAFTVIMSVYKKDNPSFFRLALESISTKQSLKPKQIIVIEDGPVSNEIDAIFKSFIDDNPSIEFLLLKNDVNKGLASSLNIAIDYCKYEWVARMDADDISSFDRFEKQFSFVRVNPQISVIGGNIMEFKEQIGDISSARIVPQTHNDICKMMKKRNPMNHMCVCFRKSAVLASGKYSETFGKLEDYKLWVDMVGKGYLFANISDVVCYARIGNGFIERRNNKREIKDWDMLQKYLLSNHLINRFEAFRNRLYIRLFIYSPNWVKKIAYKTILRN